MMPISQGTSIRKLGLLLLTVAVWHLAMPTPWAHAAGTGVGETIANVKSAFGARGREKLQMARRAAVFFSGGDPLRAKVMEDALALELMNARLEIVSRSRVETLIAEKMAETVPALSREVTKQKPEPGRRPLEPVGAVQVARAAGAQIVFIGTMLDERQHSALVSPGKISQMLDQPIVVVAVSIQVVDVETDTVLMVLLVQWPNGASFLEAADQLVKSIKEWRKVLR